VQSDPTFDAAIRLGAFAGVGLAMALWEVLAPRRVRLVPRLTRWVGNLGIVVLNSMLVRLLFPVALTAFAAGNHGAGQGLMGLAGLPFWVEVAVAVVVLDLAVYGQHVLFHFVPVLWRLHRMHHADLDYDFTTGIRFHPIEIALSMVWKFALVWALGAPALAVLIFEVVLNGTAMFNHGNVRLAPAVDRWLRRLIVTPDMHRVHHSVVPAETNSNYGFNLAVWDRLFGTYRAQPAAGHAGMTIGLGRFRDPAELRLDRMLAQPFRGAADPPGAADE